MSHTRIATLAFLVLELSPILVFDFDFLSLLCNTNFFFLKNFFWLLLLLVRRDIDLSE